MSLGQSEVVENETPIPPYRMNPRLRAVIIGGSSLVAVLLAAIILGGAIGQNQSTGSLDGISYGPGLGNTDKSIPIGTDYPSWAPSPDGAIIYAIRSHDVISIASDSGEVRTLHSGLDYMPRALALSADGTRLAVAGDVMSSQVDIFDVDKADGTIHHKYSVPVAENGTIVDLAISGDGASVYAADERAHQLVSIDSAAGNVTSSLSVQQDGYFGITVNPRTNVVYLSTGHRIDFLAPSTLKVDSTVDYSRSNLYTCCTAVSPDGKTLYASGGDSIDIYDAGNGKPQGSIKVDPHEPGYGPGRLDVSPDGKILFSNLRNAVGIFDVERKHQVGAISVDSYGGIVKTDPSDPRKVLVGPVAATHANATATLQSLDFALSRTSWLLVAIELILVVFIPVVAWLTVWTSPRWVPRVRREWADTKRLAAESKEQAENEKALRQESRATSDAVTPNDGGVGSINSPVNAFAIVSLVLGIIQGGLLAVVFGHIALSQVRRSGERGAGMAIAGLTLGYIGLAVMVGFLIWLGLLTRR